MKTKIRSLWSNFSQLMRPILSVTKSTTYQVCFWFVASSLLVGCHNDYTPKPKAYPRVSFPEQKYDLYSPSDCPFQFEKPAYSRVLNDSVFFGEKVTQPCWLTIYLPPFDGTINLTYKEIDTKNTFEKLLEDAHTMSYKHTRKAEYINEVRIQNEHGVGGILFDVGGDAASNVQFFLTDTTRHFIRGSLYFNTSPNTDSMAPVINFVKEDLKQLLKTFEWK